jgi:N6-L-threonylcarbamoyladenine synthase
MKILGIESSCDDFAVAVLDTYLKKTIHSLTIAQSHSGGVLPEQASRMHSQDAWQALQSIPCGFDAIAVTNRPGMIGSLYIGLTIAKTLSWAHNIPLVGVNHIDAHILTPAWSTEVQLPYIALVASGGHTLLAYVKDVHNIKIIGNTLDDAAGEALDKIARTLGLPYPGGPALEKLASCGNLRFEMPTPMQNHSGYNFSFSGLKEHARQLVQRIPISDYPDLAASVQHAVSQALLVRTQKALRSHPEVKHIAIAGGVAANNYIRNQLQVMATNLCVQAHFPPACVCGDNAEMIAWCGMWQLAANRYDDLRLSAYPRYSGARKAKHISVE